MKISFKHTAMSDLKPVQEITFDMYRKVVANMTLEGWDEIPHSCMTYRPVITKFLAELKKINEKFPADNKITINTALLKIISEALKAAPLMNSHLDFDRFTVTGKLKVYDQINVTMPVSLPDGAMMSFNVRDVGNKNMSEIKSTIEDIIRRGNNSDINEVLLDVSLDNTIGKLKKGEVKKTIGRVIGAKFGEGKLHELKGQEKKDYYAIPEKDRLTMKDVEQGTITISNVGSLYKNWRGECTLLEVIPPQTVAIAISSIHKEPVVNKNDEITVESVIPLCIAFDHKALDAYDIIPFVKRLDEIFDDPSNLQDWV
ncbi:MAG: 2-oxo acid dehydrogenase subunit E2 [Clostridia bacterium]|nr:2-oxo acid dehydrogenase subunit E2 [Clostridia bacterium]